MNIKILYLFFLSFFFLSCQDDNKERIIEQKKEAKKKEVIFNNINKGWVFAIPSLDATLQGKINNWQEWRVFLSEINQKPKSSIGAFQKKASVLSKKVVELNNNIPFEFRKPPIISRITVLTTKIKALDLFIHLNQIPDEKVVKLVTEINEQINSIQLQMAEIVRRSQIPVEDGEPDRIRIKDTARAVPNNMIPKEIGIE